MESFFEIAARSVEVDASSFRVLRVLRILRLVRILRVVRVLHLISELRAIVSSIVGSFRSLVWVVVLLLLMMYIVAVFFTQSITDHLVELKKTAEETNVPYTLSAEEKILTTYFGGLARAILSLWQSMSGGMDWDMLAGPLFSKISFVTGFAFTAFIAFALLALMNVVTGVFVQTALLSARLEEDTFMQSQIVSLFNIADRNNQATVISWEEIMESLDDPKQAKEWKSIGVQAEDARYLFSLLDLAGTGTVAFEEFMGGCLRVSGDAKALDLLTVMQENRRNEDFIRQRFEAVTGAVADIHETVQESQEDLTTTSRDLKELIEICAQDRIEMRCLSDGIVGEFASIKEILSTITVLQDMGYAV